MRRDNPVGAPSPLAFVNFIEAPPTCYIIGSFCCIRVQMTPRMALSFSSSSLYSLPLPFFCSPPCLILFFHPPPPHPCITIWSSSPSKEGPPLPPVPYINYSLLINDLTANLLIYLSKHIPYLSFWVWIASLRMIFFPLALSTCTDLWIHFQWLSNIRVCKCATFFFTHWSIDGRLGCFQFLAITSRAAMSVFEQLLLW